MDTQVEVTTPACALTTLTSNANARSLIHSCRNLYFNTLTAAIHIGQFEDTRNALVSLCQCHLYRRLDILSYCCAWTSRSTRSSSYIRLAGET